MSAGGGQAQRPSGIPGSHSDQQDARLLQQIARRRSRREQQRVERLPFGITIRAYVPTYYLHVPQQNMRSQSISNLFRSGGGQYESRLYLKKYGQGYLIPEFRIFSTVEQPSRTIVNLSALGRYEARQRGYGFPSPTRQNSLMITNRTQFIPLRNRRQQTQNRAGLSREEQQFYEFLERDVFRFLPPRQTVHARVLHIRMGFPCVTEGNTPTTRGITPNDMVILNRNYSTQPIFTSCMTALIDVEVRFETFPQLLQFIYDTHLYYFSFEDQNDYEPRIRITQFRRNNAGQAEGEVVLWDDSYFSFDVLPLIQSRIIT